MLRTILLICAMTLSVSKSIFAAEKIVGESLVLAADHPARLMCDQIDPKTIEVRSTYLPANVTGGIVYTLDRDYAIDPAAGTIRRLPNSRIPDFATNILYGQKDFVQDRFPGYGNHKFLVFVDYQTAHPLELTKDQHGADLLKHVAAKLHDGKPVKVVAFGDSITAGGEASSVELQYPSRYVAYLKQRFPDAKITLENTATGGDNTIMGLARLNEKFLTRHPDLVLIAFGMNDHNLPGVGGVAVPAFKANLEKMVTTIRDKTAADVILLSTFPPNPEWHYGSHQMDKYANATREATTETHAAYADVFGVFEKVLQRKDPSSLLGNDINHPTDFGHWLYLQALEALEF